MPRIHAGVPVIDSASPSTARTTAQAPSEMGGTSRTLIGQHSGREASTSSIVTSFFTCAFGLSIEFLRFFTASIAAASSLCPSLSIRARQ